MKLQYVGCCVQLPAEFVDKVMSPARELSKKGKWANLLIRLTRWKTFDVKTDWHTRLYRSGCYIIFMHSCIEYIYEIKS